MKTLSFLLCMFFFILGLNAQDETYNWAMWGYGYDMSFPTGNTSDFISDPSFLGFTIQGRKFVSSQFSIGGSLSWHVFNGQKEETRSFRFEDDGLSKDIVGSISGKQFRYINALPIMLNAHYYLGEIESEKVIVYGGLGIGVTPIKRRVEMGVFAIDETNWHFGLIPEIGILKRISSSYTFTSSLRYSNAFKASQVPNQSYMTVQVGLLMKIW